jgi:hypothetical protein
MNFDDYPENVQIMMLNEKPRIITITMEDIDDPKKTTTIKHTMPTLLEQSLALGIIKPSLYIQATEQYKTQEDKKESVDLPTPHSSSTPSPSSLPLSSSSLPHS